MDIQYRCVIILGTMGKWLLLFQLFQNRRFAPLFLAPFFTSFYTLCIRYIHTYSVYTPFK